MKRVLLVVLVGVIAVFCVMNRAPTPVWPLKSPVALFLVVLAAFALGLATGWILRVLSSSRRQAAANSPKTAEAAAERQPDAGRTV